MNNKTNKIENDESNRLFKSPFINAYNNKSPFSMKDYFKQYDSFLRLLTNNLQNSPNKCHDLNGNIVFIRIINALSNSQNIDLIINGKSTISNLAYKGFTTYIALNPGQHKIDLFSSGDNSKPLFTKTLTLLHDQYYTIAAVEDHETISVLSFTDNTILPEGESKIRFINLAPNAPNLDFAVKSGEGDVVFSNVSFKEVSEYLPLSPMTVNLELRKTGTKKVILPLYKSKFEGNKVYNLISLGLIGENSKLEVIILN